MRNLLLLLLVLGAVWLWRNWRQQNPQATRHKPPATPDTMLRCDVCGVHLPSREAVKTESGVYCCAEHQHQAQP